MVGPYPGNQNWSAKMVGNLVQIVGQDGSARTFHQDRRNGRYFSSVGDSASLVNTGGGTYELRTDSGSITRFRPDGMIDYVADANGNQVTAAYDPNDRLESLTPHQRCIANDCLHGCRIDRHHHRFGRTHYDLSVRSDRDLFDDSHDGRWQN